MPDNNSQPPRIRVSSFQGTQQPVAQQPPVQQQAVPQTLTQGLRNQPSSPLSSRKWLWVVVVISGLIVIAALGMFLMTRQQLNEVKQDLAQQQDDPTLKIREENKQLIAEVGKLIVLPADEEPTIATVSDLDKLKDQPFFAKAQLGDKVLIYTNAKKAILFRPLDEKIIELAPLINNQPSEPAPTDAVAPAVMPVPTPAP